MWHKLKPIFLVLLLQVKHPDLSDQTIKRRVVRAYDQNLCLRTGDGKRGDPHGYYLSKAGLEVVNKVKGLALLGEVQ